MLHQMKTINPRHQELARLRRRVAELETAERARIYLEESLWQHRDWLLLTLASIGDAVIATDTSGAITFMNPAAEHLTGWRAPEAHGRSIETVLQLLEAETRQPVDSPVARACSDNAVVSLAPRTVLRTRDGHEVPVADCCTPIRKDGGAPAGVVLVLRDITGQQQAEEVLLRARNLEVLGVLAGGIAHDFNNLLTGIVGNISLAKQYASAQARLVACLSAAEKACQRASALTQQLLTLAKGETPVRQPVALSELLHETTALVLRGSNVRGEYHIAADLWPVHADANQIYRVLHNVILNAVQAMPAGGTLHIQADNVSLRPGELPPLQGGRYIKIAVRDHGGGIPEEILPRIFDPYFTTKASAGGCGLGLATAYTIVSKHDGTLTVNSEVGVGTTVSFYLPASHGTVEPGQEQPAVALTGSGKILVVDDEEMLRELLSAMLTSLGYEVVCARDGMEAVAVYQRAQTAAQPFDAVILDLTLPGGIGGRDTLERLRVLDPQVTALISSGYAIDPVLTNFAQYGFRGAVAKPYTMEKLHSALQQVLQKAGRPQSA
jgi:PAS domain S-box-containing protein